MLNLEETAWDRGIADAKKWLGMIRWRIVLAVISVAGAAYGASQGLTGWAIGGIGAACGVAVVLLLVGYGIATAASRQREEARDELRTARNAKHQRRKRIGLLYTRGSELEREGITVEQYEDWKRRLKAWSDEVIPFLDEQYGSDSKERFISPGPYNAANVLGSVHKEHSNLRLKLSHRLLRMLEMRNQDPPP
jgi:hypothetical protein